MQPDKIFGIQKEYKIILIKLHNKIDIIQRVQCLSVCLSLIATVGKTAVNGR